MEVDHGAGQVDVDASAHANAAAANLLLAIANGTAAQAQVVAPVVQAQADAPVAQAPAVAPAAQDAAEAPEAPAPAIAPAAQAPAAGTVVWAVPRQCERAATYRNKDAVIVDGYTMIMHKQTANGEKVYWRCQYVNKTKCLARGISDVGSYHVMMRAGVHHNHDVNGVEIKTRNLVTETRKRAAAQKLVPSQSIVDDLLRGAEDEVVLAVKRDNLLRVANNAKKLDGAWRVNRPVAEIEWNETFSQTAIGSGFLLYDSRQREPAEPPIFIFASAIGLSQLRQRDHWAVDGTFYCVPRQFEQLFTVHAHIGHSSLPAAYMLLPNRQQATYVRAMRALISEGRLGNIAPRTIMSDFELATINALSETFRHSSIRLCLFHLAQALWRNIAEKGLLRLYKENAKAKEILRCYGALALLPPNDVPMGLEIIVAEQQRLLQSGEIPEEWEHDLACFEEYFEATYVRRLNRTGDGYEEPRFPILLWNQYHAVIGDLFRTNNATEGWHLAFNNTFSSAHMAMDKFFYRMQNDEDKARQRLLRNEFLPAEPLRRKKCPRYMASDKHIKTLAGRYDAHYRAGGEVLRYLRCVQYHLKKARFPDEPPAAEFLLADVDVGNDDGNVDGDDDFDNGIPHNESYPESDLDDDGLDLGGIPALNTQ